MIYDLKNENERIIFMKQVGFLMDNNCVCDLVQKKKTRSLLQNAALHKYFEMISQQLNEMGITFVHRGLVKDEIESPYTAKIVKDFVWRPIQMALFDIESTKDINTSQINTIIDVLSKWFAERGVMLSFPSIHSLIDQYEET